MCNIVMFLFLYKQKYVFTRFKNNTMYIMETLHATDFLLCVEALTSSH